MDQENLDETLNWLEAYLDTIKENKFVGKKDIDKIINRLTIALNMPDPLAPEKYDGLPF